MDIISYKTPAAKKQADQQWVIINVENQVLGRIASQIARLILGKHKPYFSPHIDCGDKVIVINAEKIRLTGSKWKNKEYISYTGYPGGQKITTPARMKEKFPTRIIEHAVKGMLRKNRLSRRLFHNLYVYAGTFHPHAGQQPKLLTINS